MRVLVTGATGFVGRAVLPKLSQEGHHARILLRPSAKSPRLPRGLPVEAAVSSLADERGLRAALLGVDSLIHLAGGEGEGSRAELAVSDADGTARLVAAAAEAGIRRLIFLSHLGVDRASAFPVLQAKALGEAAVRQGRVPFTILRSAIAFGPDDDWTTSMAMTLSLSPGIYLIPGADTTTLQPIWVEDLATALVWALDEPALVGRTYEIGGPEYLTWREILGLVMRETGVRRVLAGSPAPVVRALIRVGEMLLRRPPFTPFLVDYLAANRVASLETLPRAFGLQPARMEAQLEYLRGRRWGLVWLQRQLRREAGEHG